jgi:methylated-DNA-[protein]-cysteine S-methyltransferase
MTIMMVYTEIENPVVRLAVARDEQGIRRIHFLHADAKGKDRWAPQPEWKRDDRALRDAVRELRAYFAGELREFSLPLAPVGTAFQLDVWNALRAIPYGETTSYGDLAERIGRPKAVRAVGAANGANPLPIVVPCHRVIGSNGNLTGFGGGLPLKSALLALERGVRDGQRRLA